VSQNGSDGVSHSIRKVDHSVKPGQWPHPTHAERCQGSKGKAYRDAEHQAYQPFAKLKRGHGKPSPLRAHGNHGGIVDGEESSSGLIEDVQREGDRQGKPRPAETARVGVFVVPCARQFSTLEPNPANKNHSKSQVRGLKSYFATSLISPIKFPSVSRKNTIHKS
jgi:hypothetical protein